MCIRDREVAAQEQGAGARQRGEKGAAGVRGLCGVGVHAAPDVGARQLDRVVQAVAGDQGRLPGAAQLHGELAGRVTGGGQEADAGGDLGAFGGHVDQVELSGVADGVDGVPEHLAAGVVHVLAGPVVPLRTGRQVAGAGEGGDPAVLVGDGVPADVIGVQMGEEDQVHRLRGEAGRRQPLEIVRVEVVPGGVGPGFAVADAGVDEEAHALHLQREAVRGQAQVTVLVGEVRPQPGGLGQHVRGGLGQQPPAGRRGERGLVDTADGDLADRPGGDRFTDGMHELSSRGPKAKSLRYVRLARAEL